MTETIYPAVDIVIVARNEEQYIGAVIDAIYSQNYPKYLIQVIVVNNKSTDSTAEIARSKNCSVLDHEGTVASARNAGITFGNAELIAMLDGHVIPEPGWLAPMVSSFKRSSVGACMGALSHQFTEPLVQELAEESMLSEKKLVSNTVHAVNSPMPWIVTGNFMIRRSAYNLTGGFNETLFRCEDADISWRLVLLGFELLYEISARAVHHYAGTPRQFIEKHFDYGVGAAQLAHSFGYSGTKPKLESSEISTVTKILDAYYREGFSVESERIRTSTTPPLLYARPKGVLPELRLPFQWSTQESLKISTRAIYWLMSDSKAVMTSLDTKEKYVFEDAAGDIVRSICHRKSRKETIACLQELYAIDQEQAANDTDEFLETLIEAGLLAKL